MIKIPHPTKPIFLQEREIQGIIKDIPANKVHILCEATQNDMSYYFALDSAEGIALVAFAEASSDSIEVITAGKIAGTIPKEPCCGSSSGSGSGGNASTGISIAADAATVGANQATGGTNANHPDDYFGQGNGKYLGQPLAFLELSGLDTAVLTALGLTAADKVVVPVFKKA